MALQLGDLRDALLDAGAPPEKSEKAAEEFAGYENRLTGVETKLASLDARVSGLSDRVGMLTWAVGINVALTMAVLAKLFVTH